ncbi:hypothetical protein CHS0354_026416 [Potamilus streckersoni]|uniref:Mitochondria-eating protein C-terminal domain-containing protein n=1 Tax=Potamilus streckersoni TaxID=2493646 RepID=A0AAE0T353_9BIVA|nr:hypothetical protein CHS0354_026416 [Potamilus streckersoni]
METNLFVLPDFLKRCTLSGMETFGLGYLEDVWTEFNKLYVEANKYTTFSTYYFDSFLRLLRAKKWSDARDIQRGALQEIKTLIQIIEGQLEQEEQLRSLLLEGKANRRKSSMMKTFTSTRYGRFGSGRSRDSVESRDIGTMVRQESLDFFQASDLFEGVTNGTLTPSTTISGFSNNTSLRTVETISNKISHQTVKDAVKNSQKVSKNVAKTSQKQSKENVTDALKPPNKYVTNPTKHSTDSSVTFNLKSKDTIRAKVSHSSMKVEKESEIDSQSQRSNDLDSNSKPSAEKIVPQRSMTLAELVTRNQPKYLAECFSNLYNNEYRDAFEELQSHGIAENDIIYALLRIIRYAYIHCSKISVVELKRLKEEIRWELSHDRVSPEKSTSFQEVLAKRQKQNAVKMERKVCKEFLDEDFPQMLIGLDGVDQHNVSLSIFAHNCASIIWWMSVQDPPMYLSWIQDNEHSAFNKEEYKTYTRPGTHVDYCVWPVIYLQKGGPILCRGIAQGKMVI